MSPETMKRILNEAQGLLFKVEMDLREDQQTFSARELFTVKENLKDYIRKYFATVDIPK